MFVCVKLILFKRQNNDPQAEQNRTDQNRIQKIHHLLTKYFIRFSNKFTNRKTNSVHFNRESNRLFPPTYPVCCFFISLDLLWLSTTNLNVCQFSHKIINLDREKTERNGTDGMNHGLKNTTLPGLWLWFLAISIKFKTIWIIYSVN